MTDRPDVFPSRLALNAWDGGDGPVEADVAASSYAFARRPLGLDRRQFLGPPTLADPADWRDLRVGWGVILPDVAVADLPIVEQAAAADIPELAPLLAARPGAAVFRYRKDHPGTHLQRCLSDGTVKDIDIGGSMRGAAPGQLPGYLTIVAMPDAVPWALQGRLSTRAAVGRLPLAGPALANYITHLLGEWDGASARRDAAVVWAVDWGEQDITRLLRRSIADRVAALLKGDPDLTTTYLDGGGTDDQGLAAALSDTLAQATPGLIVTTSHGATMVKEGQDVLRRTLGLPLDNHRQLVQPAALLGSWQPDGAIWYAHSCCGAGSSKLSEYVELVAGDPRVVPLLEGVSALGETVAPLPLALLGADKPARAFIGHVKPTFDWTVRSPSTGQFLTDTLAHCLYDELYQPGRPVGLSMNSWYSGAGTLLATWDDANTALKAGEVKAELLGALLAARDRLGQVILGDPTVVLV